MQRCTTLRSYPRLRSFPKSFPIIPQIKAQLCRDAVQLWMRKAGANSKSRWLGSGVSSWATTSPPIVQSGADLYQISSNIIKYHQMISNVSRKVKKAHGMAIHGNVWPAFTARNHHRRILLEPQRIRHGGRSTNSNSEMFPRCKCWNQQMHTNAQAP